MVRLYFWKHKQDYQNNFVTYFGFTALKYN